VRRRDIGEREACSLEIAKARRHQVPISPCARRGTIGTPAPGANDRMVVYTKDKEYIRYPMTLLGRTPIQYDAIWQKSTYYGRRGVIEVVDPSTIAYFDKL
jgi:hypothetical protein